MYKRVVKNIKYLDFLNNYPKLNLGSLIILIFCSFLIIASTFTQIPLVILTIPEKAFTNPTGFFASITSFNELTKLYYYIPQIPVVLFIGAFLGPELGLISVVLYIIAGLVGFPVFASGGGIGYLYQQGFGYILGYFAGVYFVGKILSKKVTNFSLIRATILGVLAIHIIGALYLAGLTLIHHDSILSLLGWLWALSGMQIPYDLLVGLILVCLARPVRSILWIAMD